MSRFAILSVLAIALIPIPASAQFVPPMATTQGYGNNPSDVPYGSSYGLMPNGQQNPYAPQAQNGQNGQQQQGASTIWQYDTKYKAKMSQKSEEEKKRELLSQGIEYIYFIRPSNAGPNQATLRLVTPVALNGCVNIVPPAVSLRKSGGRLSFKIEKAAAVLEKNVRYAHFQCPQDSKFAFADITLDRAEIESDNIKTVQFQSAGGSDDIYDVTLTPEKLSLMPKSQAAFKPFTGSTKADPLSYNFYPENALILYAPNAVKGQDLSRQIATLAHSKGLAESADSSYFIDQSGALAGSLGYDANAFVGSVTTGQKFQGPEGAYVREKNVDIYARKPGMLD